MFGALGMLSLTPCFIVDPMLRRCQTSHKSQLSTVLTKLSCH